MFGFSAYSEYPISDFPFIAFVPPPPLILSGTDGYSEQQKKLKDKLDAATKARDRARIKAKENLRELISKQLGPEGESTPALDAPPDTALKATVEKVKKKTRKTLTTKPLPELEANVLLLQARMHQLNYEAWQAREYARLVALERQRAHDRKDEESLLLLL